MWNKLKLLEITFIIIGIQIINLETVSYNGDVILPASIANICFRNPPA